MILLLCLVAVFQVSPLAKVDGREPVVGAAVWNVGDVAKTADKKTLKLPTKEGVVVVFVRSYYPAQVAGLREMDIVTSIGGKRINTSDDFSKLVSEVKVGQKYKVNIRRLIGTGNQAKWRVLTLTLKPVSRKDACLEATSREKDEVRGLEFVRHRDSPQSVNERSDLSLYFVLKSGKPQGLRLKIQYVSDDWLFVQKFSVHHGEKTLEINPRPNQVERDNGIIGGSNRIWEWFDSPIPSDQIPVWRGISTSTEVILRYDGRQYFKDQRLDLNEIDRIRVVLDAYSILGGD